MHANSRLLTRWFAALVIAAGTVGLRAQQDGTQRWAVSVDGWITLSSPALSADGSTVYVGVEKGNSGHVVALGSDGSFKWRRNLPEPVDSSPSVAGNAVYIGCVDGHLYALNAETGSISWRFDARGFVTSSPAIGADGTIYFGSSSGRLHAVRADDGEERWSFPTGDIVDSSPAIGVDGTVYFGSYDRFLYAVNTDGTLKWRYPTGGRIFGSPAIGADGTIYVGSRDQRLYAIWPDGALKWDYFTNGDIESSPVLGADGTIYFTSWDANVYALNPGGTSENRVKWRTDIRATTASTAVVRGDGVIILGVGDGRVLALNPDDGSIRWTFNTKVAADDFIESSPIIGPDGSIYIGASNGKLYKLNGNGSPLSEYSSWPAFRGNATHTGRAATIAGAARLVNLSTRALAGGDDTVIVGFFVQGVDWKAFLLRGVGPTLQQFGVSGFMPDPRLDLYVGDQLQWSNDDWEESILGVADTARALEAFPLPPGSRDAALIEPLHPGLYSAHVRSADGRGGVVLVEAYEAIAAGDQSARLVNLSLRNQVGAGENVLIMGFFVTGTGPSRLLVRAVGPGLRQFAVSGVLEQPRMTVFRGNESIRSNSGWTTEKLTYDLIAAAKAVSAFPLDERSADCAMVLTVEPGAYTVQISGMNGTTGEALAEVYILP